MQNLFRLYPTRITVSLRLHQLSSMIGAVHMGSGANESSSNFVR